MGDMADCLHRNKKCVGDHGVVCADCGHIIVDGRRPDVILAEKIDRLNALLERYFVWIGMPKP